MSGKYNWPIYLYHFIPEISFNLIFNHPLNGFILFKWCCSNSYSDYLGTFTQVNLFPDRVCTKKKLQHNKYRQAVALFNH